MPAPFAPVIVGRGKYLRQTGVRERAYAGQSLAIEIVGLRDAERIPEELRAAYEAMLVRLEVGLVEMARALVPGAPDGRLGRTVHARRLAHDRVVVGTVGSKFARALNRGFVSTAKKGKALRFEDGGQVFFRHRVKVRGRHFFEKWLAEAPGVVESVYTRSFYDIKGRA